MILLYYCFFDFRWPKLLFIPHIQKPTVFPCNASLFHSPWSPTKLRDLRYSTQRSSSDQMFSVRSCFIGTPQNRIQRNSMDQKACAYQDQIALGIFIALLDRYSSWSGSNTSISLDESDVCFEDPEGRCQNVNEISKTMPWFLVTSLFASSSELSSGRRTVVLGSALTLTPTP